MLYVQMSGFHLDKSPNMTSLGSVLGFSIDKTVSDTLNPYIENTDYSCILNKTLVEKEKAGIIRFILDFKEDLKVFAWKCYMEYYSYIVVEYLIRR